MVTKKRILSKDWKGQDRGHLALFIQMPMKMIEKTLIDILKTEIVINNSIKGGMNVM